MVFFNDFIAPICEAGFDRCEQLPKLRRKRSEEKPQLIRFGNREIETLGLSQGFWGDLYHRSMIVYWPVFFGSAAAIFVALKAIFGFLYSLGHEPIANAAEKRAMERCPALPQRPAAFSVNPASVQ
jgi:hypothetical protein